MKFPTDKERPENPSYEGGVYRSKLDKETSVKLKKISEEEGVSLYMILLSAFSILLSKYSGEKDIIIGTPIANRQCQETENIIGFFVNTLVIRSQVEGKKSFRELLQETKEYVLEAHNYQDVPFE